MRLGLILLAGAALTAACNDYDAPPAAYPTAPASTDVAQTPSGDGTATSDADSYADHDPNALVDFRGALDAHGTWVDDENYGTVWVPAQAEVGADFQPYVTAGHWVYGDDYVWVSDYEWGWAPYHYGRWVYVDGRGWAWVPGRVYAGAWVTWRVGEEGYGYVGWGPMPPLWIWRGGYAVRLGFVPRTPYVFCAHGDVFAPVVATHVVRGEQVGVVAGHTRAYVPATPVVAGARVSGPAPTHLGYEPSRVPHPTGSEPGLARAQKYARPSTAQPLGARPPTTTTMSPSSSGHAPAVRSAPHAAPRGGGGGHHR